MANPKCWKADGTRTPEYAQALIYQLEQWREGRPIHCDFSDECCPDFSCCRPEMLRPEEYRREYANEQIAKLRGIQ